MMPMDLLICYDKIYIDSFVIHPDEAGGKYSITLIENDTSASLKKLTVSNVPQDTILLPLQRYSELHIGEKLKGIIKGAPGIFKCCDYLIITITQSGMYLIFIEMKSNEFIQSDVSKKFKGANCFIEYCNAIIDNFYDVPLRNKITPKMRYVLITGKRFNKKQTKLKGEKYTKLSSPDNYTCHMVGIENNSASVPFDLLK
ncbi:MAG: hypothetical protein FWG42_03480 [Clostridiales bacterium]|nr:hypothetical protein [Clostridiales bacterium]